jgi:hypothetical protein
MEKNDDNKILGKVEGVKPWDKKWDKTFINDTLSTNDIYIDVKRIKISKNEMVRSGENGLIIPDKLLNFTYCSISKRNLIKLFNNCDSYTFNTSNRFPDLPVTCIAEIKDIKLFINLHQLEKINNKICDDKSTITIGSKTYFLPDDTIKKFIEYVNNFFFFYKDKKIDLFFKEKSLINKILEKIDYYLNKNKSNYISLYTLDYFLITSKKVNVIKVYP